MGRRRALPRARDLRPPVRRGVGRHRHRDAARPRRDRGGLQGVRDERPAARGAGARLARAQARREPGAEGAVAAAARDRRVALRLRADGGGIGVGLRRDAHDRAARRRRVRPQRHQALHHERRRREALHRLREDRPDGRPRGHLGVPRRRRHARLRGDPARAEDGHLRLDHRRARLRRLPDPGREPARRGGRRLQARDADPRPLAARASRPRRSGSPRARPTTRSSTPRAGRRWASRSASTS